MARECIAKANALYQAGAVAARSCPNSATRLDATFAHGHLSCPSIAPPLHQDDSNKTVHKRDSHE
jgi:hypothetical protein